MHVMGSWDPHAQIAICVTLEEVLTAQANLGTEFETGILKLIADAKERGYDIVYLPLTTEKWKDRWRKMCILPNDVDGGDSPSLEQNAEVWRSTPAFLRDEVTLTRLDEGETIVGIVSEWLQLDSPDPWIRHDAEIALEQELAYASYLNIPTVILPCPRNRDNVSSYARSVNACLENIPYIQLSVRIPIYEPSVFHAKPASASVPHLSSMLSTSMLSTSSSVSSLSSTPSIAIPTSGSPTSRRASEGELNLTWEMWDIIRTACNYNTRLTLTLDLTPPLPSTLGILKKWAAEPVKHIFLPASTFIANSKGYPVLPKVTQSFIRESMSHRPNVVLFGTTAGLHASGSEEAYSQYIRHLEKTSPAVEAARSQGTVENFAQGYQDYLQAPLQPLMDNLQSITYQTFEQDPVKYRNYEEAIYRALVEWPRDERIVICVAGAGRGPLVARSLSAIDRSRRDVFVYAIEKNPSAYVTLQGRSESEWSARVKLVFGDMRVIDVPEKADILVSELLGSFGDNELSPECLDGAMRFLKPEGISIPSSYTSHLAPLSSSKLFADACVARGEKSAETPYVVMFQAINILSGDGGGLAGRCGPQIQECWEFEHPVKNVVLNAQGLPLTNTHNSRSATLTFHIPHAGVLHGLAGYFEAILYGNIGLSIHPHRKAQISKDMLSWFPLFFPLKDPLYLPSNSELRVSMWRLTNKRQVWYEWYAESFLPVYHTPAPQPEGSADPTNPAKAVPFSAAAVAPVAAPSPLVDAIDPPLMMVDPRELKREDEKEKLHVGVVKIGQTALHNPGGRSSWIGL